MKDLRCSLEGCPISPKHKNFKYCDEHNVLLNKDKLKAKLLGELELDSNSSESTCPYCNKGKLKIRSSRVYGKFLGCSLYPTCDYTEAYEA